MTEWDDIEDLIGAIPRYNPALDAPLPAAANCRITCIELIQIISSQDDYSTPWELRGDRIEQLLRNLPNLVDLDSLLKWESKMRENAILDPDDLRKLIVRTDPKPIASCAGIDIILWSNLNTYMQCDSRHNAFLRYYGHSAARLQVAASALPILSDVGGDPLAAMKTYELGQALTHEPAFSSLLETVSKFAQPSVHIDLGSLSKFTLEGVVIPDGRNPYGKNHKYGKVSWDIGVGELFYQFFLDAPVGVVLCYETRPIAVCAGFAVSGEDLLINQIHPVRARQITHEKGYDLEAKSFGEDPSELGMLEWKELLVNVFSGIAHALGMKRIGIQSALNNRWVMPDNKGEIDVSPMVAIEIYDRTAQSLHMTRAADGNYWIDIRLLLDQARD